MGVSIWENIGNENKMLGCMGIELKRMGMARNGEAESHSRTPTATLD